MLTRSGMTELRMFRQGLDKDIMTSVMLCSDSINRPADAIFALHNSQICYYTDVDTSIPFGVEIGEETPNEFTGTDGNGTGGFGTGILVNDGAFYALTTSNEIKTEGRNDISSVDTIVGRKSNEAAGNVLLFPVAEKMLQQRKYIFRKGGGSYAH